MFSHEIFISGDPQQKTAGNRSFRIEFCQFESAIVKRTTGRFEFVSGTVPKRQVINFLISYPYTDVTKSIQHAKTSTIRVR